MANRPTLADVAAAANVSVATVDRVLNGRQRVRPETVNKVYEAASAIGYHAANLIRDRMQAELPSIRFGCILRKQRQAFYRAFASQLETAIDNAPGIRGRCTIRFADTQEPDEIAGLMQELAGHCDVIAATSVNHHLVTKSVQTLRERGIPTFSLLSDFAQGVRESYIGLNNLKAGRIAAWMIAKTAHVPGKVALFVGGHRWQGHELRETGFRGFFRESAPDFQVLDTLINLETRDLTREAMLELLDRHPDLKGFYVAGGGMEGAIAALREASQPERLIGVVNELVPESREALLDRYLTLAIATPLERLCGDLIRLAVIAVSQGPAQTPGQHFLPIDLYLPESI